MAKPYDIQIEYQNDKYNYSLDVGQDGKKLWKVSDSKVLPPMYTSDRPLFAHIPPSQEELIEQEWFYAGMGQENFVNTKRYYNSPGCDARRKGAVVLSPKYVKSTITMGSTCQLAIGNATFDTLDTTNWTDLDEVPVASGWGKENLAGLGQEIFYQDVENYTLFQGKSITFAGSGKVSHAGVQMRVNINDGVGTTNGSWNTSTTFADMTVTRTIDAAATQVRFEVESWETLNNAGRSTWSNNMTVTVTVSDFTYLPIIKLIEYRSDIYAAAGYYLLKWDGTDWDPVRCFENVITDLAVWGDYLFVALGYSYNYFYYSPDISDWIRSTLAGGNVKYMATVGAKLWGNTSDYEVNSSTDPTNSGSWSAATTIGNSATVIEDILEHPDTVLVATNDALWEVPASGSNVNLIPIIHQDSHTNTGVNAREWNGSVYFPTNSGCLYEYDLATETISTITPTNYIPGQVAFVGRVLALTGDAEYLYAVVEYGTKVEILAGRWESIDGATDWLWHHIKELTFTDSSANVRDALISNLDSVKRLWLACAHTTDGIYYLHHPRFYGDVTQDTDYKFDTGGGDLVTSWLRGEFPNIIKTFYSLSVRNSGTAAAKTIVVSYKKEGDSSWTSLGTIDSAPSETLYFPANVTTKKLMLKFTLDTDDEAYSPVLIDYTLRCVSRPFEEDSDRLTINEDGEFRTYGGFETSWVHEEYRDTEKNWYSLTIISEGLTTAKTITIKYKVDEYASWTTLETVADTSPHQTIYFPKDTVGKILRLYFTMNSPTDTTLVAYILDGKLRPPRKKVFQFAVRLSDGATFPNQGIQRRSAVNDAAKLREIDRHKWPVVLRTFDGQEYNVTLESLTEHMAMDASHQNPEYTMEIVAQEQIIS